VLLASEVADVLVSALDVVVSLNTIELNPEEVDTCTQYRVAPVTLFHTSVTGICW
jgi:hypothetical protein